MSELENSNQIALNIAETVRDSTTVQQCATECFGTDLKVFVGGIPTGYMTSEKRFPYFLVSPSSYTMDLGECTHEIQAVLAIDAGKERDTSKGEVTDSGVIVVGHGGALAKLIEEINNALTENDEIGSFANSTTLTMDLISQYPIQSADWTFVFTDIRVFEPDDLEDSPDEDSSDIQQ